MRSVIKINLVCLMLLMILNLCFAMTCVHADEVDGLCNCQGVELDSRDAILDSTLPMTYSAFPDFVDLSTSDYFPPIGNQGGEGSCVAWATVYYQFTYEAAKYMSDKDYNAEGDDEWKPKTDEKKIFSPQYVWRYLNNGKNEGIGFEQAYNFLHEMGCIRHYQISRMDPYNSWPSCNENELLNALKIRVSNSYLYKYSEYSDTPIITDSNDDQLRNMKLLLNTGHPFTIHTCYGGFVLEELVDSGELVCTRVNYCEAGHAMTVVGYNDDIYFDLNGDNDAQEFEYGAFLLANSHGTDSLNQGYVWVMYDALNYKSNVSEFPSVSSGRVPAFTNCEYRYIEVNEPSNDIMVEVKIGQKIRNDFSIEIGSSTSSNGEATMKKTVFDGIGGEIDFNGKLLDQVYYRNFIFDYAELYDPENEYYFINISDLSSSNGSDTYIEEIKWLDSEGNVLKAISDQYVLSGNSINIVYSLTGENDIILVKNEKEVLYNELRSINSLIGLANIDSDCLSYSSSNPNIISVDEKGILTYHEKGSTDINIETTDGSNVLKRISLLYYDDFSDEFNNSYNICEGESIEGSIEIAYDVDYFKFVPPSTGYYAIYTEGNMDSILELFDLNYSSCSYNDDYSESGLYNAGIGYYLIQGYAYYIKVSAYDSDDGDYTLCVKSSDNGLVTTSYSNNETQHNYYIQGGFLNIFDTITIDYGLYSQEILITENLDNIYYEDDEFSCIIEFEPVSGTEYILWDVNVYIANDFLFNTQNFVVTFSNGNIEASYEILCN